MHIHVGSGTGVGLTKMAAFDAALNDIGIANYNMLRLSSVIPPQAEIKVYPGRIPISLPGTWGDRMYVVMAEMRLDKHNAEAWAGIGWVQDKRTGQGLFTEHEGPSEAFVRREISQTLEALMVTRKDHGDFEWSPIEMKVVGKVCTDNPVCAMVAAIFQISDWSNQPILIKAGQKAIKHLWTFGKNNR